MTRAKGVFDMPDIVQRIACKAVVVAETKVLILREAVYDDGTNAGRHILPGGRIRPGESYIEGLRREVMEETGLQIQQALPLYLGEWFPVIQGKQNQIVAIFFACTAAHTHVCVSEEHDSYLWIPPETHVQYNLVTPEGEVMDAYIRYRDAGIVR